MPAITCSRILSFHLGCRTSHFPRWWPPVDQGHSTRADEKKTQPHSRTGPIQILPVDLPSAPQNARNIIHRWRAHENRKTQPSRWNCQAPGCGSPSRPSIGVAGNPVFDPSNPLLHAQFERHTSAPKPDPLRDLFRVRSREWEPSAPSTSQAGRGAQSQTFRRGRGRPRSQVRRASNSDLRAASRHYS
jgi:hypothetical protein